MEAEELLRDVKRAGYRLSLEGDGPGDLDIVFEGPPMDEKLKHRIKENKPGLRTLIRAGEANWHTEAEWDFSRLHIPSQTHPGKVDVWMVGTRDDGAERFWFVESIESTDPRRLIMRTQKPKSENRGKRVAAGKVSKRSVGRPRKYTVFQAQKLIDVYFRTCKDTKTPYTITGLALALDTGRKYLCQWAEQDDGLGNAIKKAKTKVENYVETLLLSSKNAGGAIFWLKNFGWTDRQEIVGPGGDPVIQDPGRNVLSDAALSAAIRIGKEHLRSQGASDTKN